MIKTWHNALEQCHGQGKAYVLLTILASAGSTPRAEGTKMLVTDDSIYDTIGGGHLEHKAVHKARELLAQQQSMQHIEHYPLASKLGQCCGGTTNVLFEVFYQHVQHLFIFGAGHVAKALVPIVSQLPLQIHWCDTRSEMFTNLSVASNVKVIIEDDPSVLLQQAPSGSWMLVMTHDHQLDYQLVKNGLDQQNIEYIGMIGSKTKARRFTTRLGHQGMTAQTLTRLQSPVGIPQVPGKRPIEVAVSIAGQLIKMLNPEPMTTDIQASWKRTKEIAKLL